MKLDNLSAMVEVMPFYGTLDEAIRAMSMLSIKSKKNFDDWFTRFSKILKRKKINMSFQNALRLLDMVDEGIFKYFKHFEIELIRVWTLKDYQTLNKILARSKIKELLKINRLQLPLRENENFDMTYKEAWKIPDYTNEDRKFDKQYNKTIKLVKCMDINLIETFLYLKEVKRREIKELDRVIWFIHEDMDEDEFIEEMKQSVIKKFQ